MTADFIGTLDVFAELMRGVLEVSGARDVLVCVHTGRYGSADARFGLGPEVNVVAVRDLDAEATCVPGRGPALARASEGLSLAALDRCLAQSAFDAYLLAWDYNWHTVAHWLTAFHQAAQREGRPFLAIVHGAGWPCGDRDMYRAPALIPPESRHACVFGWQPLPPSGAALTQAADDTGAGAFAVHAGGPRNGVRRALEDFIEARPGIRLQTIEAMGGLSLIYEAADPRAATFDTLLRTVEMPLLGRLEADRVAWLREAALWRARCEAAEARYDALIHTLASGGLANMSVVPGQFYPGPGPASPPPPAGRIS